MEAVQTVAAVLSTAFAFGALVYAYRTVSESGKLRREERLIRLAGLVGELGFAMRRGSQGSAVHLSDTVPLLQMQIGYALDALPGGGFRDTYALLNLTSKEISGQDERNPLSLEDLDQFTAEALGEIHAKLPSE